MPCRPQFEPGVRLSARDLALEQQYRWEHGRMHNRFLHGWGVVCGLLVVPAGDPKTPWAVRVCPGYAISPCGDEIDVRCSVIVDIAAWLWAFRSPWEIRPPAIVLAIRFVVHDEKPAAIPAEICRCQPSEVEPSRMADDFRIDILSPADLPAPLGRVDLCEGEPAACDSREVLSPYVPLARIALPASDGILIDAANVTILGPA